MNNNTTSDSSKKRETFQSASVFQKPRHTKSQHYQDKVKKEKCSVAAAQVKEDSRKRHPKMDCISSSLELKLKECEMLFLTQRDFLIKSSKSIFKPKKKVTTHPPLPNNPPLPDLPLADEPNAPNCANQTPKLYDHEISAFITAKKLAMTYCAKYFLARTALF